MGAFLVPVLDTVQEGTKKCHSHHSDQVKKLIQTVAAFYMLNLRLDIDISFRSFTVPIQVGISLVCSENCKKQLHSDEPHVRQTAPGSALGTAPLQTPGGGRRRSNPDTHNHPNPEQKQTGS